MKARTEAFLKIVIGEMGIGLIIAYFSPIYGAFFMWGGALMSLLYGLMGMTRDKPIKGKKK